MNVGLPLVPYFSTRVPLLFQDAFVSLKATPYSPSFLSSSFLWLIAIWSHVNRLFYGEMKKNRVETKRIEKRGDCYRGRNPAVINQLRCLRALSVHTEIYSPNESIWLQMVRSLLFFPPMVPATETNEDRLDGWLVSVSGSMRRWGSRSPVIHSGKQRRTRTYGTNAKGSRCQLQPQNHRLT